MTQPALKISIAQLTPLSLGSSPATEKLSQMYKYRKGEYSPEHSQIAKIDDPDIRELILHMSAMTQPALKISIAQLTPLSLGSSPATEKRSGAK
jgi:hypothetical protein